MRPFTASPVTLLARALPGVRNRHLAILDACLLVTAALLAFVLRLDSLNLGQLALPAMVYAITAPAVKIPIFAALGVYRRFWHYANADDALVLAGAVLLAALAEAVLFLGVLVALGLPPIPRSIPVLDGILVLLAAGGSRILFRTGVQRASRWARAARPSAPRRRVLIAGAGQAGALVLKELAANPQTGLTPLGFVDDDPSKSGLRINGYPVWGACSRIPALVAAHRIDQVIIAMPSASGRAIRELVAICSAAGVAVRTLPAMHDLLAGRVALQLLRPLQIEDLLRREPVATDTAAVAALLQGKRVLVTGAGGSIGSELCRQILRCAPAELVLLGHGENSIFEIANELNAAQKSTTPGPRSQIVPVIADLRDRPRLDAIWARCRPEIVFHAAAHKHVPLMEGNPEDAITNNVLGTRQLVETCMAHGVTHFVMISTDKAVNPTSVMGATKRVAELIVQQAAGQTGHCYVAVRFGNVLGSRGSVVPVFQRQIAAGGPVTVTDPEMRRYFMTIPEAVQLVMQAAALGSGGEVFVLDMGDPVRIRDLASDLIRLSGLEPGRDIEITYTGLRPGEKLFEEIFAHREAFSRSAHAKIFVCHNGAGSENVPAGLSAAIDALVSAARRGQPGEVRRLLQCIVPEYRPEPAVPPGQATGTTDPGVAQSV